MRRRLRHCRLRHEIRAIKTRPNNPLRYFNARTVSVAVRQTIWACSVRKTSFRTKNVFTTNNTRPNQKINKPPVTGCTNFDIEFNNATCNAPSDHYFSSSAPNRNRSTENNQPEQSIKSNNQKKQSPQHSIKNQTSKQPRKTISSINHKTNHNKQPTQPLNQKYPKTNTTSNYEKMQCF